MDGGGEGAERRAVGEERPQAKAGVPIPAVRVEDPERRPAPRWTGPVPRHECVRGLADDIPAEADPRPAAELQADPGPLPDRGGHRSAEARRLQGEEADPGPPGEGGEPAQAAREPGRAGELHREVQDEEVHGPAGEERARDREALLRVGGRQDDEPLRLDAAAHRLHRVERVGEVQPGDDPARGLGLRGESQRDRRPAAREVPPEREAHPARQPAGPEDRVQVREPSGEDAGRIRDAGLDAGGGIRAAPEARIQRRDRRHRERADDLATRPRGSRAPARSKGREGRGDVRGEAAHGPSIEHLFE